MNYNFFILGGDERNVYLAESLKDDQNNVKVFGFEKYDQNFFKQRSIKVANSIHEINEEDIIISAIPFTKDDRYINMPYSEELIDINLFRNRKIIAGNIPNDFNGIDIMKDEKTTIFNTIATAEGAISKAIEMTDVNLSDSNVLVLGFGRVGKTLAIKLKGIGANVYCEARKDSDLAWIETMGLKPIDLVNLKDKICKMNVIFNTIPTMILTKEYLSLLNKAIIIDLASKPGGVDFETCQKLKIKALLYGGIPGKISPKSSAKYIKNFIYKKFA